MDSTQVFSLYIQIYKVENICGGEWKHSLECFSTDNGHLEIRICSYKILRKALLKILMCSRNLFKKVAPGKKEQIF